MNTSEQANKPAINIQELSNGEDWVILTVIRERNKLKWYLTHEQPAEQKTYGYSKKQQTWWKNGLAMQNRPFVQNLKV